MRSVANSKMRERFLWRLLAFLWAPLLSFCMRAIRKGYINVVYANPRV